MGIPTAIHEQNAYPGITNKALAEKVDVVMLTAEEAKKHMTIKNKMVVTGLPVRGELLEADPEVSRAELGFDSKPLILSMGGSLGARAINEAVTDVVSKIWKENTCNFLIATGQYGLWVPDLMKEKGVDLENAKNIEIREYINDMARCLSASDLVICRAGAMTISEMALGKKACIFVPSPYVAENHQYMNAKVLADAGAAMLIEEKDLSPKSIKECAEEIFSQKEKAASLRRNIEKFAGAGAAEAIYKDMQELMSGELLKNLIKEDAK
jgi:UDP-N-acetylglucosamine--N-acetylmuramyl-(pentapeptide) pyrophosphoryl-undecaprenol N-acetylglucosamine transferase